MRRVFLFLVAMLAALAPVSAGSVKLVTFRETTPLSANAEIVRRMISPDVAAKLGAVAGQPLDPSTEQFLVYVPDTMPAAGYGLLVFVPPWNQTRIPDGWADALDETGMILVTAAKSGNDQDDYARRVPLALIAQANVAKAYRIDPSRTFVSGFSGGARVALHLALAYPDVFKGALLDAGADPIGTEQMPLPPADLFARFQASRLVLVAGDGDTGALRMDASSMSSLKAHCVLNVEEQVLPSTGHVVADGGAFRAALMALLKPAVSVPCSASP